MDRLKELKKIRDAAIKLGWQIYPCETDEVIGMVIGTKEYLESLNLQS